jgi:hypothetical protein
VDKVLFVQIAKVDVEKREVWGRAVQEVPDKSKEIFDYATSAPLFRDWSAGFEKATADGPSRSATSARCTARSQRAKSRDRLQRRRQGDRHRREGRRRRRVEEGRGRLHRLLDRRQLREEMEGRRAHALHRAPGRDLPRRQSVRPDRALHRWSRPTASPKKRNSRHPAAPAPDPAAQTGGETAKAAAAIKRIPRSSPLLQVTSRRPSFRSRSTACRCSLRS